MSRVPLEVNIRSTAGPSTEGIELYVYERGTTDEVDVYDEEVAGSVVSQPLESDSEGRFPDCWVAPGRYDLHVPSDLLRPTQPWEAMIATASSELLSLKREAPNISGFSTTPVAVTGLNSTVVSSGRPLRVGAGLGISQGDTLYVALMLHVYEDIGDTGVFTECARNFVGYAIAASAYIPGAHLTEPRPAQPAGTEIRYEVRVATVNPGGITIFTDPGTTPTPAYLTVDEV